LVHVHVIAVAVLIWTIIIALTAEISILLIVHIVAILLLILTILAFRLNVLFNEIDDLIGNAQVLDCASANVAFVHSPELVAILED
jgi:hypothetical protein